MVLGKKLKGKRVLLNEKGFCKKKKKIKARFVLKIVPNMKKEG
jgi:hypothetical protein